MVDKEQIRENLEAVRMRIATAASETNHSAEEITLVVVTKGHSKESVRTLQELGVRDLGESYVQEGRAKQEDLAALPGMRWHMIGHVQSRKAEDVAKHFDLVHAVDSLKLAARLDRFAAEAGRLLPILLEANVSGEDSKYGWPAGTKHGLQSSIAEIEKILELRHVRVRGLMSMAPVTQKPKEARPYFARTRELREELRTRFPKVDWSQLSMGMSDDFEAAILEGATLVRIGTAILGPRPAEME